MDPKFLKMYVSNKNKIQTHKKKKKELKSTNILTEKYQKHPKISLESLASHFLARSTGQIWKLHELLTEPNIISEFHSYLP